MKLTEWLPSSKDLEALQGLERELLLRRRNGQRVSWLLVLGSLLPVLLGQDYSRLSSILDSLSSGYRPWLVLGLLALACGVYVATRYTAVLLRHTDEVFRYSFSVQPFKWATAQPGASGARVSLNAQDRIELLGLDLTQRLSKRIRRMDLLRPAPQASDSAAELSAGRSHLSIAGEVALREDRQGNWMLYALPRIRVGDANAPESLSFPVRFHLKKGAGNAIEFDAVQYHQFFERVYASVAYSIYQRIDQDLEVKLGLFPTRYRRAAAQLNEAEDLAESNTVDAIHRAGKLYAQALANLNGTWGWTVARWCKRWRLPTPLYRNAYLLRGRILTGQAICGVTTAIVGSLVGRSPQDATHGYRAPLKEIVDELTQLQSRLPTVQEGDDAATNARTHRRKQRRHALLNRVTHARFDALVALALAHLREGESADAKARLEEAKLLDNSWGALSREYLLLQADLEPDVPARVSKLRTLMERFPEFQIGQFMLAAWSEMLLRSRGELDPKRARPVVREYERVLEINPGNVAALASLGYLHWLLEESDDARRRYGEGLDLQDVEGIRDTYLGEICYGLARVFAEQGANAHYAQPSSDAGTLYEALHNYAIAVDRDSALAQGTARSPKASGTGPFEYIVPAVLRRYKRYLRRVSSIICDAQQRVGTNSVTSQETTRNLNLLSAYVANDVANAHFNGYIRLRDRGSLRNAARLSELSVRMAPDVRVFQANLRDIRSWQGSTAVPEGIEAEGTSDWTWDYRVARVLQRIDEAERMRDKQRQDRKADAAAPASNEAARALGSTATHAAVSASEHEERAKWGGLGEALIEDIARCEHIACNELPLDDRRGTDVLGMQVGSALENLNHLTLRLRFASMREPHFRVLIDLCRIRQRLIDGIGAGADADADADAGEHDDLCADLQRAVTWLSQNFSNEDMALIELKQSLKISSSADDEKRIRAYETLHRADPANCNRLDWLRVTSKDSKSGLYKQAILGLRDAHHYVPNSVRAYARQQWSQLEPPPPPQRGPVPGHPFVALDDIRSPIRAIGIELSDNLVACVADANSQLTPSASQGIADLRDAMKSAYGIRLPALNFRVADDREPNFIAIWLYEVPVARLAIPPLTTAGDQLTSVLSHIRATLEDHLHSFMGPQQAKDILDEQLDAAVIRTVMPSAMFRLSRLMRALLSQRLPVTPVKTLLELVQTDLASAAPNFDQLFMQARAIGEIRDRLRARLSDARLWPLASTAQNGLAGHLTGVGDLHCLALPAAEVQALLSECRSQWEDVPAPVLLVDDARLVGGLSSLLQYEFPHAWVVLPDELPASRLFASERPIEFRVS
jgi:tetratricopeptide (TPR) repeat protein